MLNWYDVGTVVVLLSTLISFALYWFLSKSERIKSRYFGDTPMEQNPDFILFTKYFGFVVMAVLPLLALEVIMPDGFFNYFQPGLYVSAKTVWGILIWTLGMGVPAGIIAFLLSKKTAVQAKYPEIRTRNWNRKLGIRYALSCLFYLFGYELMFRGVLFLGLTWLCGFWTAMAINLVVYSATHIPKGLDEASGALILGFFLCLATWQTQSIWASFFVHVILSWTTNYFAWRHRSLATDIN